MPLRTLSVEYRGKRVYFEMDLDLNDPNEEWMNRYFLANRCYEPEIAFVMMRALRDGDTAVDVGANVGFFTLFMSSAVGVSGHVMSFEPASNVLPGLRRNLSLNPSNNIEVYEQALWCRGEKRTFWLNADSRGSNCLWDPGLWPESPLSRASPSFSEVMTTTLDDMVGQRPVRLIKIDTEGAEQKILEGAQTVLQRQKPPYIIVECNPFGASQFGDTNESMRAFMRDFGYEAFFIDAGGQIPALVPRKTEIVNMNGVVVMNILFSTLDAIAEIYPQAPFERNP